MLFKDLTIDEIAEIRAEEAREEGHAEGKAEGKAEVIALLKKGLSLEEIEKMVTD